MDPAGDERGRLKSPRLCFARQRNDCSHRSRRKSKAGGGVSEGKLGDRYKHIRFIRVRARNTRAVAHAYVTFSLSNARAARITHPATSCLLTFRQAVYLSQVLSSFDAYHVILIPWIFIGSKSSARFSSTVNRPLSATKMREGCRNISVES